LIAFYYNSTIRWRGDNTSQWPLILQLNSREELIEILKSKHGVILNSNVLFTELLKWALLGKIGITYIKNLDKDLKNLFIVSLRKLYLKNVLFALVLLLPKYFAKIIIINGFAFFSRTNNNLGIVYKFKKNKTNLLSLLKF